MSEFLSDFISNVFELIQLDWFSYSFFAFVGIFAVCLIFFIVWGK